MGLHKNIMDDLLAFNMDSREWAVLEARNRRLLFQYAATAWPGRAAAAGMLGKRWPRVSEDKSHSPFPAGLGQEALSLCMARPVTSPDQPTLRTCCPLPQPACGEHPVARWKAGNGLVVDGGMVIVGGDRYVPHTFK